MANGSSFLDEMAEMLAEERERLKTFRAGVTRVRERIRHLEATIQMYRRRHQMSEPVRASDLKGKTQLEALLFLAEKNNGQFTVAEAKRLLLEAEMLSRRNPSTILYTLIRRSDRFDKVKAGVYKLREPAAHVTPIRSA